MNHSETALLALIRSALDTHPVELGNAVDWKEIFDLSVKHAVVALAFKGIECAPKDNLPPKPMLLNWYGNSMRINQMAAIHKEVLAEFERLMRKNAISYVVFKGLAVADAYGTLWNNRTPGDVDFYVPQWDFDKALHAIEEEWGVKVKSDYIDKHFSFAWNDVNFEMHYQMETFGKKKHQEAFGQMVDAYLKDESRCHFSVADDCETPMLPKDLDLMLVMKHWMTHLIGEGVGLRQTTDLAVLIKNYQKELNPTDLRAQLNCIGYCRAMDVVVEMVAKYYGVDWPEYRTITSASRKQNIKYADKVMETVMKNGNFGRADYKWHAGSMKRVETTWRFFKHCMRFLPLASSDILSMMPKRVLISMKAHAN